MNPAGTRLEGAHTAHGRTEPNEASEGRNHSVPRVRGAPPGDVNQRLHSIKQLLDVFKFERAVYLAVTLMSLAMLLGSAGLLMVRKEGGPAELTGLFGSAGAITFTTGRLLRMWSDALRVLYPMTARQEDEA